MKLDGVLGTVMVSDTLIFLPLKSLRSVAMCDDSLLSWPQIFKSCVDWWTNLNTSHRLIVGSILLILSDRLDSGERRRVQDPSGEREINTLCRPGVGEG